jgi:hypothetical protein
VIIIKPFDWFQALKICSWAHNGSQSTQKYQEIFAV